MIQELVDAIARGRVYDLAQEYYVGMPHHPNHPPYLFGLTKQHGEFVSQRGGSSAADSLSLSGHTGTHIDALCHFSCGGRLHGGREIVQSYGGGVQTLAVAGIGPVMRRAVMLDIAALERVDALPADFEVTPEHLEHAAQRHKAEIRPGDVVLLRTGWARFWGDAGRYVNRLQSPGPGEPGARWLSTRGIFAAGSDTLAFEKVPADMPVHVHLLFESGIHIIENLNLEGLSRDGVAEFLFIASPLKIAGGTGSPIRPFAIAG
jgi:kynurenine formamidase